jgi:hypothetical protein
MKTIASNKVNPNMPLTEQDREALNNIFEQLEVEAIKQIEETVERYAPLPLEPWEEQGWIINSSLPLPKP